MANNIVLNEGQGGKTTRTIDKSGVQTQVVTLDVGGSGAESLVSGTVPVSGTVTTNNTPLTNMGAGEYETVAASQTAQVLGATGGTGDWLSHVVCFPTTTSPGVVTILDNATQWGSFPGGASSVSNLIPFTIPVNSVSVSGAWKITTGANISCVAVGNFT